MHSASQQISERAVVASDELIVVIGEEDKGGRDEGREKDKGGRDGERDEVTGGEWYPEVDLVIIAKAWRSTGQPVT